MITLQGIAKWCIGNNTYSRSEILSQRSNMLTICIEENKPYLVKFEKLPNNQMEERQACIWAMIQEVCSLYTIKDLVFCYDTHDRADSISAPCFTHARLRNTSTRNILAPCFTFKEYPEGSQSIPKTWTETRNQLIENQIQWESKQQSCAFVGSLTHENHRIQNTSITLPVPFEINDQPASSPAFIQRHELSNYKYLLHLNGHRGAYASRLKYLLGTGSLVFYNCNSGSETNFWEEWWMNEDIFSPEKHFILCSSKDEFKNKISYYNEHQEEAKEIASNGYSFFKDFLTPDTLKHFWAHLLNEYASRLH